MKQTLRIIITGGPGTGKSTLIDLLSQQGYSCYPELARQVIKEQLELGSNLFPWADVKGYSDLLFERICCQVEDANGSGVIFFDRSPVDVLAYLELAGVGPDVEQLMAIRSLKYYPKVFYTPFWQEIYQTDSERRESPEEAKIVDDTIAQTYRNLGFELIEVPKVSPLQRLTFIEQQLAQIL